MTTERELIRELRDLVFMGCDSVYADEMVAKADAYLATPEGDTHCPHIATSREGMSYCRLAESDARDAARYRWLRDSCSASMNCVLCLRRESSEWAEEIDAAMALTKPEKSP